VRMRTSRRHETADSSCIMAAQGSNTGRPSLWLLARSSVNDYKLKPGQSMHGRHVSPKPFNQNHRWHPPARSSTWMHSALPHSTARCSGRMPVLSLTLGNPPASSISRREPAVGRAAA